MECGSQKDRKNRKSEFQFYLSIVRFRSRRFSWLTFVPFALSPLPEFKVVSDVRAIRLAQEDKAR